MTRDITVRARDEGHQEQIVSSIRRLPNVRVINVSDQVFLLHLGGKLAIQNKVSITTRDTLSMAYTPGVARVCEAIAAEQRKLQEQLDIPVFHDDQHGTPVVVLAALLKALRLTKQKLERLRVALAGAGATGMAITRILLRAGARDIVVCDREGVVHGGRLPALNQSKAWLAQHTNPRQLQGRLEDALVGANLFIGVSGRGLLQAKHLKRMARKPFVFAMANPTPEIMPEEAARVAFIAATGRSDYPNQINNVLAFPGIFRGALDVRARRITEEMKHAAARAIAGCIRPSDLSPEYIVPSVFNREVVRRVAQAVESAAVRGGVARKKS